MLRRMHTEPDNLKPLAVAPLIWLVSMAACLPACATTVLEDASTVTVQTDYYELHIIKEGFCYSLRTPDGSIIAPPHKVSGVHFGGADAAHTRRLADENANELRLEVTNQAGSTALVRITVRERHLKFFVEPQDTEPGAIVLRTGGVSPAFGLADHGGLGRTTTELTGFVDEAARAMTGGSLGDLRGVGRLISNFVIFPRQGLGQIHFEPNRKIIRLTRSENAQGSTSAAALPAVYYFFGDPPAIYREFRAARQREGYRVFEPKYDWFGLGWEAWGALAWETSQATVTANVNRYLEMGFPLTWMVVGSGFWPRHDPRFHATTSFGLWDENLYPDPRGMIEYFHQRGLKFIIGLRIAFITDGPFAAEGIARGAFIEEDGKPKVFDISFPNSPCYLLDASKPDAVQWYVELCHKWLDFGIDGFKEDLYGYHRYILPDDKIDPVNVALMEKGVYIMGRNGYVGSPMDIHRIEDFNFNQTQDRGPINCLALAYAGFACPYPDLVGGTFTIRNMPPPDSPRVKRYYMRKVRFASLTPVMAMGYGPWNMKDPQVEQVALDAARLHVRLQPYIYSAAVDAARTGFPHSFTPLPLAFPDDPQVYTLENTQHRGYQWMLGPSLLATPLYGDDYETAETRDVYLPAGRWMDWDTGQIHQGPTTLHGFALPMDKTPLFIGGKGIIVEQRCPKEPLRAVVCPVSPSGTRYTFTHPDGQQTSTIENALTDWDGPAQVVDLTAGTSPRHQIDTGSGAIHFDLMPGHDYRVQAGSSR